MDVTIKYLPTDEDPMGTVERISTPLAGDGSIEHWKAGFADLGDGWMGFRVQRGEHDQYGEWIVSEYDDLLVTDVADGDGLMDALDKYVAYITVDGMTYWANSDLGDKD